MISIKRSSEKVKIAETFFSGHFNARVYNWLYVSWGQFNITTARCKM